MEELNTLPTIDKLEKTITALASGKAPYSNVIPPEVIKEGKPRLLPHLYEILCLSK